MEDHLVSIIMPSFNSGIHINQTVATVLAQTYGNWELLITDDGSTDDTLAIIKELAASDPRIKMLKNKFTKGPAGARNTSISEAKGRFIAFLDSDDLWKPFHLQERIEHMLSGGHAFTYSWYEKINEDGTASLASHTPKRASVSYKELLTDCIIGCLTALYDTEKLGKIYMPDIKKRQDFGLWLQILKQTDRAVLYPKITATYRVRNNSVSSNKLNLIKYNWAIYRDVEKFGRIKSAYLFSIFMFKYILKKL